MPFFCSCLAFFRDIWQAYVDNIRVNVVQLSMPISWVYVTEEIPRQKLLRVYSMQYYISEEISYKRFSDFMNILKFSSKN